MTKTQRPLWLLPALWTLIVLHGALVIANVASFFVLPLYSHWWEAIPLCTFIWFFSTTKVECKCTNLENHWREKAGWPTISSFVGHYFLKPVYRRVRRRMKKQKTT